MTVEEARKVETMLGRPPTVVEAIIWGIQGSEHCSYKSSKRFLRQFPTTGKHVILGPKEDSGIVAMTDGPPGKRWGIVVSHESHNHPSQVVPYEGAATGVGGNVRDVACMGARVIGSLDALRFGDLQSDESRAIAREVVRGIAGYGNALGVPTLGGDTQFHAGYNQNCLVNVVCLGIVREDEIIHSYVPEEAGRVGYDIILVGKPTDRSGFGGAAFASLTLEEEDREKNTGAVQEPNPFLERHLLAATYSLFDWLAATKNLSKVSFKDLGAGGVVCSTVEQVANQNLGAEVDLTKVHTAIPNLPPEVIACAETQERFCWMAHPELTEHILRHYNEVWDLPSVAEHARASVIGKVTKEPIYRLRYRGEIVCEAKALDIACGLQYERPLKPKEIKYQEPNIGKIDIADVFRRMLMHPNNASKTPIFRHYDKNVQGNTLLECGEGDAGVIAPLQNLKSYVHEGDHPGWELQESDQWVGVAISCDGNGRYGLLSPYLQGVNATVEAMRNVAATGATPRALTDCLNYGNPENPQELWELAEGVRGIADAAKGV
ncbi:MAG: AIR synthase related protein, partial [Patescibacteria group bacterium]